MMRLAEPLSLGNLELRNRLVFPPVTSNSGTTDGEVTDASLGFYSQRSRDVGMVIVEATTVRADGRITPYSLGLWSDAQRAGMSRLARAIREKGAAPAIQIGHAGARGIPVPGGIMGASPSGVAMRPDVDPTVLTHEQIAQFVLDFARAAVRAAEAGFEAVEVHAAHFYLLSQFLSPLTNQREDGYGGSLEGRSAGPIEVVRAIRAALGPDYPIIVRINAVEAVPGGMEIEEGAAVASLLARAGASCIHASLVVAGGWKVVEGRQLLQGSSALPKDRPMGANLPLAKRVKETAGIPVIAVGKLGDRAVAEAGVESGDADLIAIGRQLLVDPAAAGKILGDREGEMVRCRECMGCFASLAKTSPITCAVNRDLVGEPVYLAS